jgi:hypothetical protein
VEPTTSRARVAVRVLAFAVLVGVPTTTMILSASGEVETGESVLDAISLSIYAAIAGIVIFRRQGHLVGWLLLAVGAAVVTISRVSLVPGLPDWVGPWAESFGWPMVFGLFAGLTLVFPSGRLPEGRGFWPRIGRIAGLWLPIAVAITGLTRLTGGPVAGVENPLGVLPSWLWYPAWLATLLALVGGAASLGFRRRKATGAERAQLGWVVLPLVVLAMVVVATSVFVFTSEVVGGEAVGDDAWTGVYVVMLIFPVAFGVAVLRYRLYEIDRIISRTLAYGLVTTILLAVYLGTVFVLGAALPSDTNLAVAASTLVSAALFNPLRRRTQAIVDRRFNRSRFNAQLTMEALSRRLTTEVDLGALGSELRGFAFQTMQPESAAVWIRGAT